MRALAIIAAFAVVALLSGLAAYEWRSLDEPARIEPIELRPAPEREEPREHPRSDRRRAEGPAGSSSSGAAPVAPPPAPTGGGGGDDDGADNDADDDGDD